MLDQPITLGGEHIAKLLNLLTKNCYLLKDSPNASEII